MYDGTHFTSVRQASKRVAGGIDRHVSPEEIQALVAQANQMRAAAIGEAVANLVAGPVLRYRRWSHDRAALRELEALDDRMLADIGLTREQVRALPLSQAAAADPAGDGALTTFVRKQIVEPFVRWRMRNRTRRELSALDNAMLHDIGIERGQIDGIARAVSDGNFAGVGAPVPVGLALGWIDVPAPANSNSLRLRAAVVTDAAD